MKPPKLRLIISIFAFLLLIIALFLIKTLYPLTKAEPSHLVHIGLLTVFVNLLLILIWMGFGKVLGILLSLVSLGIIYRSFFAHGVKAEIFYIVSFLATVGVGYGFCKKFFIFEQEQKLKDEKEEEKTNLLKDNTEQNSKEIAHLEWRLARYLELNKITENFSSTLSEENIARVIVENTHNIFNKSDRILLFRVDTEKQELYLVHSKKSSDISYVKLKKGDIFDRWVFWKKQPLLVENIYKDFRFSLESEKVKRGFNSLISAPIMSGEKVLGLLRADSRRPHFYTQDDLRLLNIISGLAAVALENAVLYKRLSELAITDGLTSLYVHKYFKEKLAKEIKRSIKTGSPFSVVLLDIDDFKEYNDKYGHIAGDLVLKHIASILSNSLSAGDMAARYGGEEFVLLLLGKNAKDAVKFSEEIRKKIEKTPVILRRKEMYTTVSIGIAACPRDSNLAEDLFGYADKRLYKAKEKGKNQVCSF